MVHSNGYVPTGGWKHFGNGRLLGVELEVVHNKVTMQNTDGKCSIDTWINRNLGYDKVHVCRDGSVYDGVELVTHPMSLSEHKILWCKILRYLNRSGWKADTFNRYPIGLHIHFNIKHCTDIYNHIYRIGSFILRNKSKFERLCGRSENEYAKWNTNWDSHYNFLNIRYNSIIEFRACKSTIKYFTLIGRLELTLALADFASTIGEILVWNNFLVFIGDKYPYLKRLMKEERLIHVNGNNRAIASA